MIYNDFIIIYYRINLYMNAFIEITKSYIFCEYCEKCYIYKGSYEKHLVICSKKEDNIIFSIKDTNSVSNEKNDIIYELNPYEYEYENEYENYELINIDREKMVELICPGYLFLMALLFGFIKGLFIGF